MAILRTMLRVMKVAFVLITIASATALVACPRRQTSEAPEEVYHIGTWAGTVEVDATMVLMATPTPGQPVQLPYWNAVWHVEANVHLNEFQDGSLTGTAEGNLFHWFTYSDQILEHDQIKAGHWDRYAVFTVDLNGRLDNEGYVLDAGELPKTVPESHSPDGMMDFYDFLFPMTIEGKWPQDGSKVMEAESMRVQGNDYQETRRLSNFREFSIVYSWNIRRL